MARSASAVRAAVGAAALAAAISAPRAASAEPSVGATDRFFLGLGVHSSHIGSDEPTDDAPAGAVFVDENGQGVGIVVGYGITPALVLRLSLLGAEHETTDPNVEFAFSSGTIDGVYHFSVGQPLRPYLFGGFGGFSIESRKDALRFETTGPGVVFGGGLLYFLGRHFGVDLGVRGNLISWEKSEAEARLSDGTTVAVERPIEEDGSAAQFALGATWWF
jgi:hypothetical protein